MKRLLSMLLALAISCSYLSLAALAAEGEDETPKVTITLPEGVDVAFSAVPDASHTLGALTVTGLPVGTPAPVITNGMGTVKAVNGLQIHASFDILTYTVDVRQAPGGTISARTARPRPTAASPSPPRRMITTNSPTSWWTARR